MIFIRKIKFVGLFRKLLTQSVSQHADEPEGLGRDFDVKDQLVEKRADGKMAMTRVTLRPRVAWGGSPPDEAAIADLHHRAHEACFIANSVTTDVTVAP